MKSIKAGLKVFTYPKPKHVIKMTGIVVSTAFVVSMMIAAESAVISSVITLIVK